MRPKVKASAAPAPVDDETTGPPTFNPMSAAITAALKKTGWTAGRQESVIKNYLAMHKTEEEVLAYLAKAVEAAQ